MPEFPYPPITDINITAHVVYKLLSKLVPYEAPGPDTISGHF